MKINIRCWNVRQQEMFYNIQNGIDVGYDQSFGSILRDDNYIIMASSNLYDKNNKEMFENDVFKYNDKYGIIKFSRGCFVFITYNTLMTCLKNESNEFEIVGNIYENPEYLSIITKEK